MAKDLHLVLNTYERNDSIDPNQDISTSYHGRNPIASLSYGRGSNLTIQDSTKPPMAIIRWRRYGVQTFKHPGAFSRYTLLNNRSVSMPELRQIGQPTIVEGMDVENQQMERDGKNRV